MTNKYFNKLYFLWLFVPTCFSVINKNSMCKNISTLNHKTSLNFTLTNNFGSNLRKLKIANLQLEKLPIILSWLLIEKYL